AVGRGRIERAVVLGEIKRDGERLPQRKAAVVDRRQAAVGIDREVVRLARAGRADLDRHMLVIEAELLRDPERAKGAGAGDAIDPQRRHAIAPRYSGWMLAAFTSSPRAAGPRSTISASSSGVPGATATPR